jgi:hypothetical protein
MTNETEMFTVYGETDGLALTGTFDLIAPIIYGTDAYLRIPRGMKLKIHALRLNGDAANDTQANVMFTHDVTAGVPTWVESAVLVLDATRNRVSEDKRKPIIFQGFSGDEAVSFDWVQTGAAVAYLEADVEYTPM